MGYYVRHTLIKPIPKNWTIDMIDALIEIQPNYFPDKMAVDDFIHGDMEESKWYEFEEDFGKLSEKFPDLIFEIEGKGEDGNCWKQWFKNGKSQSSDGKIVFEEYDENKLK